jgi:hypothetical protein
MLVMVLRWKRLTENGNLFFPTNIAPVNSRVGCVRAWLMESVEGITNIQF